MNWPKAKRGKAPACSDTLASGTTREDTPPKERPLKCVVSVVATTAKARHFTRSEQPVKGSPIRTQHLPADIRVQTAQRFARQDAQLDRNQRPTTWVQNTMRLGCTDQPVSPVLPRPANGRDLRILGVGVFDLGVARLDLGADGGRIQRRREGAGSAALKAAQRGVREV